MKKEDISLIFSGLSTLMALVALGIAYQGNEINRRVSVPSVQAQTPYPYAFLSPQGCGTKQQDKITYRHVLSTIEIPQLANTGGASINLVRVSVESEPYYWKIEVFQNGRAISLPVEIPAYSEPYLLFGAWTEGPELNSVLEVSRFEHSLIDDARLIRWKFFLGDGQAITITRSLAMPHEAIVGADLYGIRDCSEALDILRESWFRLSRH
ncbi:MAG: hypothetical protein M3328_17890 [Chloroflexota bacterium]|nr:hypothetical protein [Chloroflexota bacterium]